MNTLVDRLDGTPLNATGDKKTGATCVVDVTSGPVRGVSVLTPSDTATLAAGTTGLLISCTTAGNVKAMFADGSTFTFAVAAGTALYPFSVTRIFVTGTSAVATYADIVV